MCVCFFAENTQVYPSQDADSDGGRLRRRRDHFEDAAEHHQGQKPQQLEGHQQRRNADVGQRGEVDQPRQGAARKVGRKEVGQSFHPEDWRQPENPVDAEDEEKITFSKSASVFGATFLRISKFLS